jgi:hypothetical protein
MTPRKWSVLKALGLKSARAFYTNVSYVAAHGHAVIGFIEYVPPEREGQPQWLV